MERPRKAGRWLLGAALVGVAGVAGVGRAQGGPPALSAMHHMAWLQVDTLAFAGARTLLRSTDGYLWLASARGLLRFDGVRFTLLDSAHAAALRSDVPGVFVPRLVDRQGTMWIARPDGALLSYRDGTFAVRVPVAAHAGTEVVEDGAGVLWIRRTGTLQLSHWRDGRLQRVTLPPGLPDTAIIQVVADTGSGLWIGTRYDGLWHLSGGEARAASPPKDPTPGVRRSDGANTVFPLVQARDGAVWAFAGGRLCCDVYRIHGGAWSRVRLPGPAASSIGLRARAAASDPDGAVWITTNGDGVLRWRAGTLEQFTQHDGLSNTSAHAVLPDHEGSTWITTDAGLDRLRPAAIRTLGEKDGLPVPVAIRAVTDVNGALWIEGKAGPGEGIYRLSGGAVDGTGAERARAEPARVRPSDGLFQLLTPSRDGGVWVAAHDGGLARLDARGLTHFSAATGVPPLRFWRAVEGRDGTLWVGLLRRGLSRVRAGRWAAVPLTARGRESVTAFVEDGRGHLWASVARVAELYELAGDRVIGRFGAKDGLPEAITDLVAEGRDTVWGAGQGSLVRIAGGRVAVVPATSVGHLLRSEHGLVIADGRLWIASEAGIVHVPLAQLHRIADGASERLLPTSVTALDGAPIARVTSNSAEPIWRSADGRVWITTPLGVAVASADPERHGRNPHPPRVHIEEVLVDGRASAARGALSVAPRPGRVEVRFTATGLRVPERVRIEYRLDGVDRDWRAAGTPRTATYTELRPGRFRFRVRAWNEDAVPGAREATLALEVRPAWYETDWAAGLGVVGVAGLGAAGASAVAQVRRRRREAARQATAAERVRVARELHDTILGDLAGLAMRLDVMAGHVQRSSAVAPLQGSVLLELRDQARRTLDETRRAVTAMRATTNEIVPLWAQLADVGRRVFAGTEVAVQVRHVGAPQSHAADLEAEVLRIATEALVNARAHSGCRTVSIVCAYGSDRYLRQARQTALTITVQDDGHGFDAAGNGAGAAAVGHWGLAGMHERAAALGGTLTIASDPGSGTTVRLAVPVGGDGTRA